MRILIAETVVESQMFDKLAAYGNIDIVKNGRDAVMAYVDTASKGGFYDLIVLDSNLQILDGFEAGELIRMHESEHVKSGKRTTICVISDDESCSHYHTTGGDKDEQTHILAAPVNLDALESLAASVAVDWSEAI